MADAFRRDDAERVQALTAAQRVELTARLAQDDLRAFAAAQGTDEADACRALSRRRQVGRRRSAVMEALLR